MHDCLFTEFAPAERSTAEELERQRRMFEGEQFFCDMVARLPEVVLVLNGNRQTVFANPAALAMLRMDSLDEALGRREILVDVGTITQLSWVDSVARSAIDLETVRRSPLVHTAHHA